LSQEFLLTVHLRGVVHDEKKIQLTRHWRVTIASGTTESVVAIAIAVAIAVAIAIAIAIAVAIAIAITIASGAPRSFTRASSALIIVIAVGRFTLTAAIGEKREAQKRHAEHPGHRI
jgi:uncharacterized RDD family membrane protein YckC